MFICEYVFLDENVKEVKKVIEQNIIIGTNVDHSSHGKGKIGGIFGDDGWIIHFENKKKQYVDKSMLIQDLRYELL